MDFEVYCDESMPDLFTSAAPKATFVMIGGLWIPADVRTEFKRSVAEARQRHNVWGEIKWTKVSPARVAFYEELIDVFLGSAARFRCIAVDRNQVNMALHGHDKELGFYKFYYQMLHHWILDFNSYAIFCDTKTNRDPARLSDLRRCLGYANISAEVTSVQALPSSEVVLLQTCDLLLGAASSRLNSTLREGSAKELLVRKLESGLQTDRLKPTAPFVKKFNVFKIRLDGGW